MSAFRACAETSMWDSAPPPEPRRGRQEVRCATLTVPVDYDAAFVIGCNDSASGAPAAQLRAEAARLAITYPRFRRVRLVVALLDDAAPSPPIPDTITASPVLVIATDADPSTPHSGGVAIARALGPGANLLTVSGGGHTASGRSPCVAEQVTRYLVELRVPGGQAC